MKLHLRDGVVEKPAPLLMGILNVTPDSFSDGGRFLDPAAALAQAAVADAGADMVNDISGLGFAAEMAGTVARLSVPLILMHIQGTPADMQLDPRYDDVLAEIEAFFAARIARAEAAGIERRRLLLDPGIGFGKRLGDNIAILRGLARLGRFGLELVVGVSRKSFLGQISGERVPENRGAETVAASLVAWRHGAAVLRTHEIKPLAAALKVWRELAAPEKT